MDEESKEYGGQPKESQEQRIKSKNDPEYWRRQEILNILYASLMEMIKTMPKRDYTFARSL